MSITPLPSAPAVTDTTSEFNTKAFNWVAALSTFTTEANAQAVAVDADATAAAASASDALAAASSALATVGAMAWVSGTTYATGAAVYSPLNKQTYRRNSAGAGTTDPSLDAVNWTQVRLDPIDATQAEMEAGTETAVRSVSPLRVKQAIDSLASEVVGSIKSFANTSTSASYPGTKWKKMDNTTYLQSAYPELYSKLGTVINNSVNFTFSSIGGTISSNSAGGIIGPTNVGENFVWVASQNTFFTSTDTVTWTARSLPTYALGAYYRYGNKVNNLYMAYGQITTNIGSILTSTNGVTWTNKTITHTASNVPFFGGAYGNGVYVFVGQNGLACTSTDLVTFTQRTLSVSSDNYSVAFGNGVFVAGVQYKGMFSSTDGITWTSRSVTSGNDNYLRVIFENNLFVATGPRIATSTDGITWTARSVITQSHIDITYAKGLYVSLGTSAAAYSADAITWINFTAWVGSQNNAIGASKGNALFLIGAQWDGSATYKGTFTGISYNTSTEFVIPSATQQAFGTSVYIKAT